MTWGPPCTSTSGLCTFTVTADEQVTATIEPPLVVDITQTVPAGSSGGNNYGGVGSIDVTSAGQTQSCIQDRCGFDLLGAVTLTPYYQVYGSPPWGVVVEQWGGPCVGAGASCALNVTSSTEVSVVLSPPNQVFTIGPLALSAILPMGLVPTLRATQRLAPTAIRSHMSRGLASSTRNPAHLLAAGAGWHLGPGSQPWNLTARDIADLTGPRLFLPLQAGGDMPIVTGANPDGTPLSPSENCQDWTSQTGTTPVGTSGGIGYAWSVDVGAPQISCTGSALVVCFGNGIAGTLVPQPVATHVPHRLLVLSLGPKQWADGRQ